MINAHERQREIIDLLYTQYQTKGYITEDEALNLMIEHDLPLGEVDRVTEQLLSMSILILTDQDDLDASDDDDYDRSRIDYGALFDRVIKIEPELEKFIEEVRSIQPPQHREWINLMPQVKSGNEYAHTRLFQMYLRVVIKIALWHHDKYDAPLADTIQDGCIGLLNAIDKFEFGKQDLFTTYAPWWIRQAITREMQFQPNTVFYFPVHYKDGLLAIYSRVKEHSCEYCFSGKICEILVIEVMEQLQCPKEDACRYLQFFNTPLSYETLDPIRESDYGAFASDMEEGVEAAMRRIELYRQIDTLSPIQKQVIILRNGLSGKEPMTLEEVGTIRNVTRERIRQIENKALIKLRHPSRTKYLV